MNSLTPEALQKLLSSIPSGMSLGVQGKVTTAEALSKDDKQLVEKLLQQGFDSIEVSYEVSSEILGGIRVEVGDWVFDGTVAKELTQLVAALKA